VTAETLYEAVAQALAWFAVTTGSATSEQGLTTFTVKVRNPEITQVVKIQDFLRLAQQGL
jgi:hypothetical protein